ncbi:MAG: hypothetical protein AB7G93_07705 [Bdellovibrionales bacterium]
MKSLLNSALFLFLVSTVSVPAQAAIQPGQVHGLSGLSLLCETDTHAQIALTLGEEMDSTQSFLTGASYTATVHSQLGGGETVVHATALQTRVQVGTTFQLVLPGGDSELNITYIGFTSSPATIPISFAGSLSSLVPGGTQQLLHCSF